MDWVSTLSGHWFWLSLGLILIAAEMAAPGFFLMWLGAAAVATGVAAWLLPLPLQIEVLLFAVLAMVAVFAAKKWFKDNPIVSDDPMLNDRAARMVGDVVTVVAAIEGGEGRVRHGDSEWTAHGPDAPVGTRLRITGVSGSVLQVEAVQPLLR